jgi:hypothetical protein
MNELTASESHELEKCFYEMQGTCQQEIKIIDEILFPSKSPISLNIDFNTILAEPTNKITFAITSAITTFLLVLIKHEIPKDKTLPSNHPIITQFVKEKFINDLNKEIKLLISSIVSAKFNNTVLHPTILIPLHKLTNPIEHIRPSTLFSLAHEVLIKLNK